MSVISIKSIKAKFINGDVLFESQLPGRSFLGLHQLRELSIERCKLSELPGDLFTGLQELRHLTIQTFNTDWGDLSLRFSETNPNALFATTRQLETIDLSENVLTDRGFSRLARLQVLNLRHNLIVRAEETSLAGLNELSRLDLSNNQLVALPARFFQAVKVSLSELYLQNNSISVIPPGLFSGLAQVIELDLSNNEVTSHWIGPTTFSDMSRLLSLDLSYNKLSRIDANAFRALFTLQSLSLKYNEIESLAENAFSTNRNLHTLSLSGNRLMTLNAATFTGLEVLNALFLDSNRFQNIHPAAFSNVSGLMELNISNNRLDQVPQAIQNLRSLRSLDLSYNKIQDISNASYRGLEQLYGLNLEANIIGNLSRGDFLDLPSLRVLNLAANRIGSVEQGTFDNIPDLHALRLDSNSVIDINRLFVNLRDLLMLNISANRIELFDYAMIPVGLQWLDLHQNLIENLGNYFEIESELKLRTLDASSNRLTDIDASSLPDSIELVMLNNNQLRKVAPFTFLKKDNLTRADLSSNQLSTLDLNALRLSKVPTRRPLPEFSIAGNPFVCDCNIEWLQLATALQNQQQQQSLPNSLSSTIPSFVNNDDTSRQYPRVVDANQVQCRLMFGRGQMPIITSLLATRSSQFLCPYRSHCFALCHCCEFDACDCEMTCPDNCSCFYDQSWNTNIVDCGRNNHQLVPTRIPMDVTNLYLDGNNIAELSPHTFIGRKNLRYLYLNGSHIQAINNRTFNGLKSLLVLNLADNQLTTLFGYEFERLVDLSELYLQNNLISVIANNTFRALRSLKILRLDHNRIVEFELWSMSTPTLEELYLGSNAWSCDCYFVGQMMEWLPSRQKVIKDLQNVYCQYNETFSVAMAPIAYPGNYQLTNEIEQTRANITAACSLYAKRELISAQSSSSSSSSGSNGILGPNSSQANNQIEMFLPILVLIIVSTLAILLLLASIVTAVLYRHEISVWFFARTGIRFGRGLSGADKKGRRGRRHRGRRGRHSDPYDGDCGEKLFDAFVSYSKKDEQFVQQMLAPELEYGNTPMRLCLHYRDLPVASGFVADAIIEAMAASRRSILVISEHFLRGEWMQYEFKAAHQEALRSRARHKLILIFVGPVAGKDLDPDIRVWLKTSGNTCLQWGEKMFWEKLQYAMPEIPTASSGGGSSANSSSSSTTSSLYGRKAMQLIQQSHQKGSTLPLSGLSSGQHTPRNFESYQQQLSFGGQSTLQQLHHPLLSGSTLNRLGQHPSYQTTMDPNVHPLYSPSSLHSQQSTYAYPTYHPISSLTAAAPPPPLSLSLAGGNPHHQSMVQSTPPPLPPAHPLHQRLFNNHSGGSSSGTTDTTMETSSGHQHSHLQQQQQLQQQHLHQNSNLSNNGHFISANNEQSSNGLMINTSGSDFSGQPTTTMPFVPTASSTTAVAVHI
ncbi:Toll/interleukin-1 receptor-like protein [Sarcoptes scabiei]|uniref:Toll/interleukin-1 receptor-like protein n=1 Tax=Sarcoptes scabiei TaxID=52283 RepID=A0A132AF72_SARSC|nr:Toll/interleukin-1 receptor-like protein [Sarcoptes scabiei]